MARPENPLVRDGSPVREFAYWLRDLRNSSGLTYEQLAKRTNFSRATLQEALSGRRLPTWQVTQAIARACGGNEELWHSYWGQIKRATDRDAPPGSAVSVTPPWRAVSGSGEVRGVPADGDANEPDSRALGSAVKRRRLWVWASSGGVAVVAAGVLATVLLSGSSQSSTFPNPYHHPKAPPIRATTRTYTEQEFNPNGAPTFLYLDGSGAGIPVAYGQLVQVSCKVHSTIVKSTKPDGYWYRLASMPWDDNYYAVANTFGNGDKLHHPPYTHNTDWKVPNCKPAPTQ